MIDFGKPFPVKDNRPKSLKEDKKEIDNSMSINEVKFPTKHANCKKSSVQVNLSNPLEFGVKK